MALAVDLYHPTTGQHKRVVVDTASGDVAAETASRMYPALFVRSVMPVSDASEPELRLSPGAAVRFDGKPFDNEYKDDLGAGTEPTVSADASVASVPDASPAPTPEKRGRGRPLGAKNKPKQLVEAEIAAEQKELMSRGPSVDRPDTSHEAL